MSFVGRTRDLAAARRELETRQLLVVSGAPDSDRSAFLDAVAREAADEAGLPVYRFRVADAGERSGEAGRTSGEAADTVVEACRGVLAVDPCVVVVDGVPAGTADGSLLAELISAFAGSQSFLLVGSTDAREDAAALSSDRCADGWALLARAAVHCDRGDPRAAGPLLRRAVEAHQVAGDRRGEAWAVFLYGRMCRLRGRLEDARRLLQAARETFRAVGEAPGEAWAAVELARLATRSGSPDPDALAEARRLHERAGDRRGAAWAHLWWTVARADEPGFPWQEEFASVQGRFHEVSDRLGTAWTLHHHALTLARTDGTDRTDRTDEQPARG